MALWPAGHLVYRPAHAHVNLLGFLSMFLFGVAYHVIPRFVGRPLHSSAMAMWHLRIANFGLALMTIGWFMRPTWPQAGRGVLVVGGVVSTIGVAIFIYLIWRATADAPNVELSNPGT